MNVEPMLEQLTLEEKASLLSGANFWNTKSVERLGIPSIMMTDGPHGLRKQGGSEDHLGLHNSLPATCFPTAAALANSWDTELLFDVGQALGKEAAAERVSVVLGPGLNIKRSPLAGRNFEYFSEDPYLSGKLAASMVRGIQSEGVAACPKHFAVNSQEKYRMAVDEVVDQRALHEIYLEGFRRTVEESNPLFLMSSYNRVNGAYANEHQYLLRDVLRDTWQFDGVVVSDWGGNADRVAAVRAGGTLEMPSTSGVTDAQVVEAVTLGDLDEADVDKRVEELLRVVGQVLPESDREVDLSSNHRLAVRAAEESAVLLQNCGVLPLAPGTKVAVVGDFAKAPRYQGAGSSLVNPSRLDDALTALEQSNLQVVGFEPGFKRLGGESKRLREAAVQLATRSEVVLLFLGLDEATEAEGKDRRHLRLARAQLKLTRELILTGVPVVVVLSGGSPMELPFAQHVPAILNLYLGGQGGGTAAARILTGQVNPSGKLAETFPLAYADTPASPWYLQGSARAEHRESIYVGYRYYDKTRTSVRFPFGHGLSYTTFEYESLEADQKGAQVRITNTGTVSGSEIVQFYVGPKEQGFWAPQQLKAFARVSLRPGESKTVQVDFDDKTFAFYDVESSHWKTLAGEYEIAAAASSQDHRARASIVVDGDSRPRGTPNYEAGTVHAVGEAEFEALLGRGLPPKEWSPGPLDQNSLIVQARNRSFAGQMLLGSLKAARFTLMKTGQPLVANYTYFLEELPFRAISRMSAGKVSPAVMTGILQVFNGDYRNGLRSLLPGSANQ